MQIYSNLDLTAEEARVGYTASRKVGGAVERNRAKRRLRALVREIFPCHVQQGMDYVLIERSNILSRAYDKMLEELSKVLKNHHEK